MVSSSKPSKKRSTGKTSRPGTKKGTGRAKRPEPPPRPSGPNPAAVFAAAGAVLALLAVALYVAFSNSGDPSPAVADASPSASAAASLAPSASPSPTPSPSAEPEEPEEGGDEGEEGGEDLEAMLAKAEPSRAPAPKPSAAPSPRPAATPSEFGPGGALTGDPAKVEISGESEEVEVKRVIDGDTFDTTDGRRIRMIGINTPERGRPFKEEATDALRELTKSGKVTIEYDGPKSKAKGRYGRTLAYVYCDGVFVTGEIVRRGLAYVYLYPDTKAHNEDLIRYQREARAAKRYLWNKPLPEPAPFYIGNRRAPYFHREGCGRIKRLSKGSKYRVEFKTRNEALDSGFNPCDDCKS